MAYNATVLASYSEEVEDVLRGLVTSQPLINLCHAQAGTELVDLEVTTGRTREDLSMYARTSLRAFVDLLEGSDVVIEHVVRVSYKLTATAASHVVVLGAGGVYLCSCLQLLQHGFPCRHVFAVMQLQGPALPSACCTFDANCVHPRWRNIRSLQDEKWTASELVPDKHKWTAVGEGPLWDGGENLQGAGQLSGGEDDERDSSPKVSEGARRKTYADGLAMTREMVAEVVDSVSPAVALDIFSAVREVADSRLRAEGVLRVVTPDLTGRSGQGALQNAKPALKKGRKKNKRHKSSTERR